MAVVHVFRKYWKYWNLVFKILSRYVLDTFLRTYPITYLKINRIFDIKKALGIRAFKDLLISSTTILIFFSTFTWTLYSHIFCIICIYNITCISGFSRLGNIYIICIICTIYIINNSLLWTNCGHRPHPFIWYDYINFCIFIQSAIYLFSICFVSPNSLSKSDT